MPTEDSVGDALHAQPGIWPGMNRKNGRIFCKKLHKCGYCTNTFVAMSKNGRRPCPQCQSFKDGGASA